MKLCNGVKIAGSKMLIVPLRLSTGASRSGAGRRRPSSVCPAGRNRVHPLDLREPAVVVRCESRWREGRDRKTLSVPVVLPGNRGTGRKKAG